MKYILCLGIFFLLATRTMAQTPNKPPVKSGSDRIPAKQKATLPISGGGAASGTSMINTATTASSRSVVSTGSGAAGGSGSASSKRAPLRTADAPKGGTKQTPNQSTVKSSLPSATAAPKATQQQ